MNRDDSAALGGGLRVLGAVWAGRLTGTASRRLGRGGGTALPGLVAERMEPRIVERLAVQLGRGSCVITGTNGKTTSALLVAEMACAAGLLPLHNRSGSNLMRGLAATLVDEVDARGRIPQAERRLGIFEVDEATLPAAVAALRPRAVTLGNLFRDQLDRYGEVDSVAVRWRQALAALPQETTVAFNADDPSVATLAEAHRGRRLFFGLEDARVAQGRPEHAADVRWCPRCGTDYAYAVAYYGHLGHWRCQGCGDARPPLDVAALAVQLQGLAATQVAIRLPAAATVTVTLPLGGLYNVYNALAAVATAVALGLPPEAMATGLASAPAAFGRQERFLITGREVVVLLGKNPAGFNQLLHGLRSEPGEKRLVLMLNDGIADGRDVSWIWDVDFELLLGQTAWAVVSGRRATDLALRLKYAGLEPLLTLEEEAEGALRAALERTPEGERLYVLPTYTAMLRARALLARWAARPPFWEA